MGHSASLSASFRLCHGGRPLAEQLLIHGKMFMTRREEGDDVGSEERKGDETIVSFVKT